MKGIIVFPVESTMLKHTQKKQAVLDATLEGVKSSSEPSQGGKPKESWERVQVASSV